METTQQYTAHRIIDPIFQTYKVEVINREGTVVANGSSRRSFDNALDFAIDAMFEDGYHDCDVHCDPAEPKLENRTPFHDVALALDFFAKAQIGGAK